MKTKLILLSTFILIASSCSKDDLSIPNPNQPSQSSLNSESGALAYGLGIYEKFTGIQNTLPGGGTSGFMAAIMFHSQMGDDMFVPYGNWGARWTEQVKSITIQSNGTVVNGANTTTIPQKDQLQSTNTREAGENNAFQYEWYSMYLTIGQCNTLLGAIDLLKISDTRKKTLKAFCYWWKGVSYSRIGSIYLSGLIVDDFGVTTGGYKDRASIVAEGNKQFDNAAAILSTLTADEIYTSTMKAVVPDFSGNANVVSPTSWVRMINTYKARNLMVNQKVKTMTPADWTAILNLANQGLTASDNIFTLGQTPDGNRDLAGNFWHPYNLTNESSGFWFSSERLIQEYKVGDARKTKGFDLWANVGQVSPGANIRGRGLLFGTRYTFTYIENGGLYSSLDGNVGQWPISPSYEENELMKAEAKIRTGDLTGLVHVDNVRAFQSAGLAAVNGTGLTAAQALEEFRTERRVALVMRGLAFYDARRWGVTEPVANGGGRVGAIVYVPGNLLGGGAAQAVPCDIDYSYIDYWDVPLNELDFNIALPGSSATKN